MSADKGGPLRVTIEEAAKARYDAEQGDSLTRIQYRLRVMLEAGAMLAAAIDQRSAETEALPGNVASTTGGDDRPGEGGA